MDSQHRDAHLPEVNHEAHSYLYSVPDHTHPRSVTVTPNKGYEYNTPYQVAHLPTGTRKGWTRWWVLAFIGVLIAFIAGLVGGFIGQAIQKGRDSSSQPLPQSSPSPSACPSSNSTSSAVTPPEGSSSDTIGRIVRPDTGCGWPGSRQRRKMANVSTYAQVNYTTICNSGWPGDEGILGVWTLTPSDCIESCAKFNVNQALQKESRRCVGGGFIPDWTNRTADSREQKGPPFNCYLQSTTTKIANNDQENFGLEVVALCLEGQCDNISLP
ncbi:hypothetical protein BKA63DRAFT_312702 [Paraphoma chrysanthemicola]|nr:hypothetical protein BKA63DRAFT_312702 [Paraphoma chrysanthemicola]